jgi:nucleoside-diphosphate-sugar epimerase
VTRVVALTGASGYLGGRVAAALRDAGFTVRRLVRTPSEAGDAAFRLGEPVDPAALRGADALIHAAHDFRAFGREETRRVNVAGADALFDAAAAAGVRRLVAVSSVSAYRGCASEYGRAKLLLEESAARRGGVSVRPGLVYGGGSGGMFATLEKLCRLPVLPVADGGRQPMLLGHADDVSRAIVAALDWDPAGLGGPVLLAHPEPVPFGEILRTVARARGRRLALVPVPSTLMLGGLRAAEALGLRLPARSDSLTSLLAPDPAPDFSASKRLGLSFRRFLDSYAI